MDSFHRELMSVGILFLLPHTVTIFTLFQVAEHQTTLLMISSEKFWEKLTAQEGEQRGKGRQFHDLFLLDIGVGSAEESWHSEPL